jgi:rSAM/selenodomain-associated transferase 2
MPVLHESGIINEAVDHIRSLDGGDAVELIVVDGAQEMDTLSVIEHSDVMKISSKKGRGVQMNTGAKASTGEILVFLHADTKLPANGLTLIKESLDEINVMAGAFTLNFDKAPLLLKMTLPIHDVRGRLTRITYGDQSIFMKKETFQEIGEFMDYRIMEDADLMRRMKKAGMKIRILKEKVSTSPRRFERRGIIRSILENIILVTLFHLGADPERLARRYYNDDLRLSKKNTA